MCNDCSNKKMSIVSIFKPCEGFPLQCWKENGLGDTDVGFVCEQKIERNHNAAIVWPAGQIQPTEWLSLARHHNPDFSENSFSTFVSLQVSHMAWHHSFVVAMLCMQYVFCFTYYILK